MKDRILVALRPEEVPLLRRDLEGHFDFTIAHTLKEATASIDGRTGLIICGLHFDEGAMFDLLKEVKSHPQWRDIPFFLILREDTTYGHAIIKAVRQAAKLLGADDFIDLGELQLKMSDAEVLEDLRARVRRALKAS